VQRLLDAALQLPTKWPSTPLRPWVFHCPLGLLSVTGLRISEALDLKIDDVDLKQGVLTIRAAKRGQWRLVPIHASTVAALTDYLQRREQFLGQTRPQPALHMRLRRLECGINQAQRRGNPAVRIHVIDNTDGIGESGVDDVRGRRQAFHTGDGRAALEVTLASVRWTSKLPSTTPFMRTM
jgi:integrase